MKKILLSAGLMVVLLLAGCLSEIDHPTAPDIPKGKGMVNLSIEGANGRTAYPHEWEDFVYTVTFTAEGKTPVVKELVEGKLSVILDFGDWVFNITAKAAGGTDVIGTAGPFQVKIEYGKTYEFDDIFIKPAAGKGFLVWEVDFPEGISEAKIYWGTEASQQQNLLSPLTTSGSIELDTGTYLFRVLLKDGDLSAGRVEVVHIYPGLNTSITDGIWEFPKSAFGLETFWESLIQSMYPGAYKLNNKGLKTSTSWGTTITDNVVSWIDNFVDVGLAFPTTDATLNFADYEALILAFEITDVTGGGGISFNFMKGSESADANSLKGFYPIDGTSNPIGQDGMFLAVISGEHYAQMIATDGFSLKNNTWNDTYKSAYKMIFEAIMLLPKRDLSDFGDKDDAYILDPTLFVRNWGSINPAFDMILFNSGIVDYTFPAGLDITDYDKLVIAYTVISAPPTGTMNIIIKDSAGGDLAYKDISRDTEPEPIIIDITKLANGNPSNMSTKFSIQTNTGGHTNGYIVKIDELGLLPREGTLTITAPDNALLIGALKGNDTTLAFTAYDNKGADVTSAVEWFVMDAETGGNAAAGASIAAGVLTVTSDTPSTYWVHAKEGALHSAAYKVVTNKTAVWDFKTVPGWIPYATNADPELNNVMNKTNAAIGYGLLLKGGYISVGTDDVETQPGVRWLPNQNGPSGAGATQGAVQLGGNAPINKGGFAVLSDITGPFKVTFKYTNTGSNNARYIIVSNSDSAIDDVNGPSTFASSELVTLDYTYTGTNKVTLTLGANDPIRIFDIALDVYIPPIPVAEVTLSESNLNFLVSDTTGKPLTATVLPANAANKNVTWSVEPADVVSLSATTGASITVTRVGVTDATAVITGTTEDGAKTAVCNVSVSASAVAVTGVSLDKSVIPLALGGTSSSLTATVEPSNATNNAVTWSAEPAGVVLLSATTGGTIFVIPVGEGTAVITVKTTDGDKTATCSATVTWDGVYKLVIRNMNRAGVDAGTLSGLTTPDNAQLLQWTGPAWSNPEGITVVNREPDVRPGHDSARPFIGNSTVGYITPPIVGAYTLAIKATVTESSTSTDKGFVVARFYQPESFVSYTPGTPAVPPTEARDNAFMPPAVGLVHFNSGLTRILRATGTQAVTGNVNASVTPNVVQVEYLYKLVFNADGSVGGGLYNANTDALISSVSLGASSLAYLNTTIGIDKPFSPAFWIADNTIKITEIYVIKPADTVINPTTVVLNKSSTELLVGATETLTATILPTLATDKTVTWESRSPLIATVSSAGEVTAVAAGTAQIVAKSANGIESAVCTVTVNVPVTIIEGIEITTTSVPDLWPGQNSAPLAFRILPSNFSGDLTATWSSDNPAIATVDPETGVVTAIAGGTATIRVTSTAKDAANNSKTATIGVKVVNAVTLFDWDARTDAHFAPIGKADDGAGTVYNNTNDPFSTTNVLHRAGDRTYHYAGKEIIMQNFAFTGNLTATGYAPATFGPMLTAAAGTSFNVATQYERTITRPGYDLNEPVSPSLQIGSNVRGRTTGGGLPQGPDGYMGQFDFSDTVVRIVVDYTPVQGRDGGATNLLIGAIHNNVTAPVTSAQTLWVNGSNVKSWANFAAFNADPMVGHVNTFEHIFSTVDATGDALTALKEGYISIRAGGANTRIIVHSVLIQVESTSSDTVVHITMPGDKGNNLIVTGGNNTTITKTGLTRNVTFAVSNPQQGQTYTWLVDGVAKATGNSIVINAADYGVGSHTVRLRIQIAGDPAPWTAPTALGFTVRY